VAVVQPGDGPSAGEQTTETIKPSNQLINKSIKSIDQSIKQ